LPICARSIVIEAELIKNDQTGAAAEFKTHISD